MKNQEIRQMEGLDRLRTLSLDDFEVHHGTFVTRYGEHDDTRYEFEGLGWRISLFQTFGRYPWIANVTHPDGYRGETHGMATASEALQYVKSQLFA